MVREATQSPHLKMWGRDDLPKAVQSHSPRYGAAGLRPQKLPLCTQEKSGHRRSFSHCHTHQAEDWDLLRVEKNLIKEEAPPHTCVHARTRTHTHPHTYGVV